MFLSSEVAVAKSISYVLMCACCVRTFYIQILRVSNKKTSPQETRR